VVAIPGECRQWDWPAAFALVGTILLCGVFGLYQAWKIYSSRAPETE
jgi:hypothetical protein